LLSSLVLLVSLFVLLCSSLFMRVDPWLNNQIDQASLEQAERNRLIFSNNYSHSLASFPPRRCPCLSLWKNRLSLGAGQLKFLAEALHGLLKFSRCSLNVRDQGSNGTGVVGGVGPRHRPDDIGKRLGAQALGSPRKAGEQGGKLLRVAAIA
jgi:hypothetical protein